MLVLALCLVYNVYINVLPGLQSRVLSVLPLPLSLSNVLGKPSTNTYTDMLYHHTHGILDMTAMVLSLCL